MSIPGGTTAGAMVAEELEQVTSIADPAERARLASTRLTHHQRIVGELSAVRKSAIAELRNRGMSLRQVADVLGVSRARAAQLQTSGPASKRADSEADPLLTSETAATSELWDQFAQARLSGQALPQLVNPGKIGMTEVNETRETLHLLYNLDQRIGGDTLRNAALTQFRQISWWLNRASYKAEIGRTLQSLASYAALNAAWFSLDSGLPVDDARYLFTEALTAAELSDDKMQTVDVLQMMSLHSGWLKRPREAIQLAQRAQQVAKGIVSPRIEALLAVREAQGWALLGDTSAVIQSHTQAMRKFELGPSDADPQWLDFFDIIEMMGEIGANYLLLEQPTNAEKSLRKITEISQGRSRQRNFVGWNFEFADALGRGGKVDEACTVTRQTLPALVEISSTRMNNMLLGVLRTLQPYQDEPDVRDLMEQTRELLPAPQTSLGDLPSG